MTGLLSSKTAERLSMTLRILPEEERVFSNPRRTTLVSTTNRSEEVGTGCLPLPVLLPIVSRSRFVNEAVQLGLINFPTRTHEFGKRSRPRLAVESEIFFDEHLHIATRRHAETLGLAG